MARKKEKAVMDFQIGDQVVHRTYGPGEIIELDEKEISGEKALYYVVKIRDLLLWVPTEKMDNPSLREQTPVSEYKKLFAILRSPGEPLSENRLERKTQLTEAMHEGSLASLCRVIRDLAYHKQTQNLAESDNAILERAKDFLLSEWSLSQGIAYNEAKQELSRLLAEGGRH